MANWSAEDNIPLLALFVFLFLNHCTPTKYMIEASELFLTPEGAVYHLNLLPGEVADTIITVGDPGRVAQVSRYFDTIEVTKQHREFVTHTGYIGKKRLSVISSGIGPDNIDIVMNELDALFNIDLKTRTEKEPVKKSLKIIRLGTSGTLQADIPVDSYIVSSFAIGLDNLMHFYRQEPNAEEQYILNELLHHTLLQGQSIQPYIAEASIQLLNQFTDGYIHGITVTCPGFFAPQGRRIRLPLAYPNLIDQLSTFKSGQHRISNLEMETSAIYGLGKLLGHQCLSINTIIANRQNKTFTNQLRDAVDKMILKSLEIIEHL